MKKLFLISSLALLATSCIPDKSKIEKEKQNRSADSIRNNGVDSAVISTDKKVDTTAVK